MHHQALSNSAYSTTQAPLFNVNLLPSNALNVTPFMPSNIPSQSPSSIQAQPS